MKFLSNISTVLLFFGYTSDFQALAKQIPATASHVMLRIDRVPYMGQTGVYALEDILLDLESKYIYTLIIAPQKQPLMMKRIDNVPDLVPEEHIYDDFESCLKYIKETVEHKYEAHISISANLN